MHLIAKLTNIDSITLRIRGWAVVFLHGIPLGVCHSWHLLMIQSFFLHHCNIDRLWAVWQQKHSSPTNEYLPTAGEEPGHNLPDVMAYFLPPTWPVTTTIADVIDHHAINTWYDTDKPIVSMPVGSLNFGNCTFRSNYLPSYPIRCANLSSSPL